MKTGLQIISEERERQIKQENWTLEHDDAHDREELAKAAVSYALPFHMRNDPIPPQAWPFYYGWWKPSPGNRIKELAKAGALIAAEIDRLQRLANKPVSPILPSEAVAVFAAWLLNRPTPETAKDVVQLDAKEMAQAISEFCTIQDWKPCREGWQHHVKVIS